MAICPRIPLRSMRATSQLKPFLPTRIAAMLLRSLMQAIALALVAFPAGAQVLDLGKYPDLKGQWRRAPVPGAVGQPPHDPSKPSGRGQQAPLTGEYQAVFEANLADQAQGGC